MGYKEALEAAGCKIKEFQEFGSYQGTWMAFLENGYIIEGSFGSCSGCDAFQAEFDSWDYEEQPDYQNRLKKFGELYSGEACPLSQVLVQYKSKCEDEYAWEDDKEIYAWLQGLKTEGAE